MKVFRRKALSRIGLSAFLGIAASCICSAATFTASGHDSDGNVSAQAVITAGTGTVSITLSNLLGFENSIGQAVSDISFTISGAHSNASYGTSSATVINIASGGSVTSSTSSTSNNGFGWNLSTSGSGSSRSVTLDALGGGQPNDLIVGTGGYGNGGFGPHNPSLQGSATFNLSLAGVTSASTISNVVFSFGTGPELTLNGTPGSNPSPVPEPTSVLLLGTAFAISAKMLYRRRSA